MKTTPLLARPAAPRLKPGAWMGWAGALLLAATGCATCPRDPHTGRRPDPEPAPYMRVACPDAGTVELQIAVRRFGPARGGGPVVWLAGASHIGDPGYYAALQRHLDAQALVLYEGVKELNDTTPSPARPGAKEADGRGGGGGGGSEDDSLQAGLARALGLVFQLDALDYSRPACRNSDLSVTQIQALLTGSRGVGPSPSPSPGTAPG
ncbi:MAG: hypothetical protein JXQ71_06370, partial [Verrucomicrobia bacterium]|nr:hypothetical protein [Verrucomicrobiota bacterium]